VGEITWSSMPIPLANPWVKVVFPVPSSPIKATTDLSGIFGAKF